MGDCSPTTTQLLVGSYILKIEVPDSHFLVACVKEANVLLSIKASKYMCCCHFCGRGLRYCLQRETVLFLSEVNGSAFVPRCSGISAQIFGVVILHSVSLKRVLCLSLQCRGLFLYL